MTDTGDERTREALGLLAWSVGLVLVIAVGTTVALPIVFHRSGGADGEHRLITYFFTSTVMTSALVEGALAWGLAALARVAPSALARGVLVAGAVGTALDATIPVAIDALDNLGLVRDDAARSIAVHALLAVLPYATAAGAAGLAGGLAFVADARGRRRLAAFLTAVAAACVLDDLVLARVLRDLAPLYGFVRFALRLLVPLVAAIVLRRAMSPLAGAWRRAGRALGVFTGAVVARVALGLAAVGVLLHAAGPPIEYEVIRLATAVFPVPIALLGIPLVASLYRFSRAPSPRSARATLLASAVVLTLALGFEGRIAWLEAYEHLEGGMHGWIQRELDVITLIAASVGALGALLFAAGLAQLGDAVLRGRALQLIVAMAAAVGVAVLAAALEVAAGLIFLPVALLSAVAFARAIARALAVCRERETDPLKVPANRPTHDS
jgi:hypothetical protein